MISVLVIDDDRTIRETLADFFATLGYAARSAATATEGRASAAANAPDVALVDLRLPDATGLTLLEALQADDPELGVIMLTGHADVPTAVRAMQKGALDFLEKPVDLETLEASVSRVAELVRLRREVARHRTVQDERVRSAAAPPASLERLVELAAQNDDVPVLIVGETGTGKGFLARRIHDRSSRSAQPFVDVNGASLSATFLESELFGHERGAFTDAKSAKRGLFEIASNGTLFLDEVGELATEVQPKLLKVLEDGAYRRLGGTTELRSGAHLIAATNRPLVELVSAGRFRPDLFYRLQVLTLAIPPLRERPSELMLLASTLLPKGATLGATAMPAIVAYGWPGNVRELKNALWRAALLADGAPIESLHLALTGAAVGSSAPEDLSLASSERAAIRRALAATDGNRVRAAELLGIARSTLQEKLRKLGDE